MRGLESRTIMTKIKAISYIGSKDRLNSIISKNLPINVKTYCEPFSGGFSLAINLLNEGYLKDCRVVYNDLDMELSNYFKCLKDDTMLLVDCLIDVMQDVVREYGKNDTTIKGIVQRLKNKYATENNIYMQSALYYWIKKSNRGGYNDYVNVAETPNIIYLSGMLNLASRVLQSVEIENKSYKDLLYLDSDETFWYLDPPYMGYANELFYSQCNIDDEFNHVALRDYLKGVKGKFILSYNDCKGIRDLYKDFKIYNITMASNLGATGYTSELLISNYELDLADNTTIELYSSRGVSDRNASDKRDEKHEVWDISFDELFDD